MDDLEIYSPFAKGMWLALQRIAGKLQEFGQERVKHQNPGKTLSFPLSTAFISYHVVLSSASDYLRLPNTWIFYR